MDSKKDPSSSDSTNNGSLDPIPPVSIPDHQLLRRIARGSYGEVWMARSSMGMLRAIKIVHRKTFQDQRPFERELSGIRRFEPISRSHEGFVDVLHAGINEPEGYFYYIMELADDLHKGQDIDPQNYEPRTLARELAPHGKLPIQECLSLGLGLSRALAELHGHGLVHRDVKPSNIIFVHGVPKLADIGLVADMDEARSYVGTEGFIPPEGPGRPQADIYGLGKVLYEACTGRDRNDFPDLPSNWDHRPESDLFLELNEVILHACKNDVARRYQTASDMHGDLVLLSNGKSVRRLRLLERRWAKLKGVAVASGIALLVATAVGYHFYWEWRTRLEMRQRDVGGLVVKGLIAVDGADLFTALTNFAPCVLLDKGNTDLEALHRFRFASVLNFCPKLEQMSFSSDPIDRLTVAPDGSHFLVLKDDGFVGFLTPGKLAPGSPLFGLSHVYDTAYAADGRSIFVSGEGDEVSVWNSSGSECLGYLPHKGRVFSVVSTEDGLHAVTGCDDRVARLWNVGTKLVEQAFRGHTGAVNHAALNPVADLLLTGGRDATAILWKRSTGEKLKVFNHDSGSWVFHVAFSPDGSLMATACSDHKGRIFDVRTRSEILPRLHHDEGLSCIEFSPDGRWVLTASLDHTVRLWLASTHERLLPAGILMHSERVMAAHFLPDGHRIITACYDGTIRLWEMAGASVLPPTNTSLFSQDGNAFLSYSNQTVIAKDAVSGADLAGWTNSFDKPAFQLSSNGRFVVEYPSPETNATGSREIFFINTSAPNSRTHIEFPEPPRGVRIDNSGDMLTMFSQTNLYLWDVTQGRQLHPPFSHTQDIVSAFLSADGRFVGTWSANTVRLWECRSGHEALSQRFPFEITAAVLSPDGNVLVTCGEDGDFNALPVQLWQTATGRALPFQLLHNDGVLCAAFSPDGRRLVTGSQDFTARIWDPKTGRSMGHPMKHRERVNTVAYSPDGKWILTASVDGAARIWSAETGDLLTPALQHFFPLRKAIFVGNATAVLTVDRNATQRLWKLDIELAPAGELAEFSSFLAGQVTARPLNLGLEHLDNSAVSNAWVRLQKLRPSAFTISPHQIAAWHRFEAQESKLETNPHAESFHLKRISDPNAEESKRLRTIEAEEAAAAAK